jgi:peptidoglycan hydrolase-like protein with peptidoglycan-binding domain
MGSVLNMRLVRFVVLASLTLAVPALAAHRTTHHSVTTSHKLLARHAAAKPKFQSQRAMDDDRAAQIQSALIRAGYLSGSPTGRWDNESEAAMQKLQGDNGWQTKIVPDSRALIKLGLGPSATPATTTPATSPFSSLAPTASPNLLAQSTR